MIRNLIVVLIVFASLLSTITVSAQDETSVIDLIRYLQRSDEQGYGEAAWNSLSTTQQVSVINALRSAPSRITWNVTSTIRTAAGSCKTITIRHAKIFVTDLFVLWHEIDVCYNGRKFTQVEHDTWAEVFAPLTQFMGITSHKVTGGIRKPNFYSRVTGHFCTYGVYDTIGAVCTQHYYMWIQVRISANGTVTQVLGG